MTIENQKEIERVAKLKAVKNYELSENYKALEVDVKDRKERAKATVVTAYLSTAEDGEIFTEVKKYNHKNKFAWGIETMAEMLELIDDTEGGKLIKEKIQEGIDNSEEHIGLGLVRLFPGSNMTEYGYTDIQWTDSDRIIYKAQVAADTLRVIDGLIKELSKEAEQDVDGGTDEEVIEDTTTDEEVE